MAKGLRRLVLALVIVGAAAAVLSVGSPVFACHASNGCDVCDTPAYQEAGQTCILRTFVCNEGSWSEEYCWG